ncbi:hypothetical protein M426DRAFT_16352 [Hypoxylon sp. CI-4A]|nr:hypothetical protein M426DRAFT_16352 [Hypoxylon sp. CI-4A]
MILRDIDAMTTDTPLRNEKFFLMSHFSFLEARSVSGGTPYSADPVWLLVDARSFLKSKCVGCDNICESATNTMTQQTVEPPKLKAPRDLTGMKLMMEHLGVGSHHGYLLYGP